MDFEIVDVNTTLLISDYSKPKFTGFSLRKLMWTYFYPRKFDAVNFLLKLRDDLPFLEPLSRLGFDDKSAWHPGRLAKRQELDAIDAGIGIGRPKFNFIRIAAQQQAPALGPGCVANGAIGKSRIPPVKQRSHDLVV
jgi:hypothetical protein